MHNKKKISLVIPCRNEANHLHEVINKIPKYIDEIIVVSNKSKDNTYERAKELGVVALEDNRTIDGIGYGFAHMTGMSHAKGDYIVAMDGDGTYPIEKTAEIIDFMEKEGYDFVSGNRYPLKDGTKIPFKLQLGVNILNWEIRLLYGIPIKDALSGMWVFKRSILKDLNLTMGEWNLSPQIKINAAQSPKIKFTEYHIQQYQRHGDTKQNYFKTGFNHFKWILLNRFKKQ
jgi:glycosyltransferase involved in cell wall biosynthesis